MTQDFAAPPGFAPYPDPVDVFATALDEHVKVFHPLLTVPAAQIDPAWTGQFHFVLPIEPYDGALGEGGLAYYGPHCGEAWIKFVREDSKYRFAGDWRYFEINRERGDTEAEHWYDVINRSYMEHRRAWHEDGRMTKGFRDSYWVNQLGGRATAGNWSNALRSEADVIRWGRKPHRLMGLEETIDGDTFVHPLNEQGQPYRLVGILTGYLYRDHGADKLLLFYDPSSSSVLLMLDFS
ncbi:hypothetical protein [Variovorax sp. LT1R16]|uniref:hypothetical protein n=1 Tax=Variovorax sp. LT1R16 TaxID=3443728 RepID=UPI003F482C3E